jgi:hypothetical protein
MYSDRFTVFDPKNFLKKKRILFIEHSIYTYKLFLDSFMKHVGDQFEFITSNSPVLNNVEREKTIKKWIHPENIFDESLFKTIENLKSEEINDKTLIISEQDHHNQKDNKLYECLNQFPNITMMLLDYSVQNYTKREMDCFDLILFGFPFLRDQFLRDQSIEDTYGFDYYNISIGVWDKIETESRMLNANNRKHVFAYHPEICVVQIYYIDEIINYHHIGKKYEKKKTETTIFPNENKIETNSNSIKSNIIPKLEEAEKNENKNENEKNEEKIEFNISISGKSISQISNIVIHLK